MNEPEMTAAELEAARQDEMAMYEAEARAEDWAAHAEHAADVAAFYDDPRGN